MLILFIVGIIAGLIEASAGGSGLVSLPVILFLGYQPIEAIATSKFQFAFGAIAAITRFSRAGLLEWKKVAPMIPISFLAGGFGAIILTTVDAKIVAFLIPILLIFSAIYFLLSSRISDQENSALISFRQFGFIVVPLVAFYDGFFGVGSASLYMTALVMLLGMNIRVATSTTKVLDLASGLAALLVLFFKGHVLLLPGLSLGAGQIIGGYFGASLVLRWGARWVRPVIVIVTLCLSADLLIKNWGFVLRFIDAISLQVRN